MKVWASALLCLLLSALTNTADASLSDQLTRATQVQTITTKAIRDNGDVVESRGSGIVLGDLYITASHNLDPNYRNMRYTTEHYLGGIRVWPLAMDRANDIAVIRIPVKLCPAWCNARTRPLLGDIGLQQSVEWVRKIEVPSTWKRARVLSLTAPVSATGRTECDRGMVVEITQPFIPGSSGTAVWDALTHQLLGMALGSFEFSNGTHSGYFKPLHCIFEYLDRTGISYLP